MKNKANKQAVNNNQCDKVRLEEKVIKWFALNHSALLFLAVSAHIAYSLNVVPRCKLYWTLNKTAYGVCCWSNWWVVWRRTRGGCLRLAADVVCIYKIHLMACFMNRSDSLFFILFFSRDWLVLKDWDDNAVRYKWGSCKKSHLKNQGEA